jgi:hypothetical protein
MSIELKMALLIESHNTQLKRTPDSIVDTQRQLLNQPSLSRLQTNPITMHHKNDRGTSSPSPPHSALVPSSVVDMTGDSGRSFGPCLWAVGFLFRDR